MEIKVVYLGPRPFTILCKQHRQVNVKTDICYVIQLLFSWKFVRTRVLSGLKVLTCSCPAQLKPGLHQQEFEKSGNAPPPTNF